MDDLECFGSNAAATAADNGSGHEQKSGIWDPDISSLITCFDADRGPNDTTYSETVLDQPYRKASDVFHDLTVVGNYNAGGHLSVVPATKIYDYDNANIDRLPDPAITMNYDHIE